ncbi:hypothetical protein CYMTET_33741 [Cymbomonas tetramitiformis]|uniref:SURF1-like protein n=1 Tax=Cymbomonas tetramitiformis TaxID=36881 RepID=A0AAE0KQN0_9CHLO|nr:hypothetical protein CYMTET_33741 [Cymbomonas tetramitiformis]
MIRAASSFMAHLCLRSVPSSLQCTKLTSASAYAKGSGLIASQEYNCCRQYCSTGGASEHGTPWMGYLLFGIPCAATAYLGTWQLQRYQWKSDLIASREEQLSKDPISLRALYESEEQILEYHKVLCEGVLDIKSSKFVRPSVQALRHWRVPSSFVRIRQTTWRSDSKRMDYARLPPCRFSDLCD